MQTISPSTIELISALTRPLVSAGALHKSERHSLLMILNQHSAARLTRNKPTQKLMTIAGAAEALQVSTKTISRMVQRGELKGVYVIPGSERTLRVTIESVDAIACG